MDIARWPDRKVITCWNSGIKKYALSVEDQLKRGNVLEQGEKRMADFAAWTAIPDTMNWSCANERAGLNGVCED